MFILHNQHDSRTDANWHSAPSQSQPFTLPDEKATIAFGQRLAKSITLGMVIYLRGDLGAGKTTMVRAILNALGYEGKVKSPTYTLLEQYEAGGLNLRHFDLYRFQDVNEWESAGFNDEFDGKNICLVEWPEQAADLIPGADLEIIFEITTDGRRIQLQANNDTGSKCIESLQN